METNGTEGMREEGSREKDEPHAGEVGYFWISAL